MWWRRAIFALCVIPALAAWVLTFPLAPILWIITGKGFCELSDYFADLGDRLYCWASGEDYKW